MKRTRQSDSKAFTGMLVLIPSWGLIILGMIAYFFFQWLPNVVTGILHDPLIQIAPTLGNLALLFFVVGAVIGAVRRFTNRGLLEGQSGLESLRSMDPKEFEFLWRRLTSAKVMSWTTRFTQVLTAGLMWS